MLFLLTKKYKNMYCCELKVRDYECDLQGIVNNAVYMSYLEHARHQILREKKIDFKEMHEKGLDLVLLRAEMDFKSSLNPGDSFRIESEIVKESRLRYVFLQKILRGDQEILTAKMTAVCVDRKRGRAVVFDLLD